MNRTPPSKRPSNPPPRLTYVQPGESTQHQGYLIDEEEEDTLEDKDKKEKILFPLDEFYTNMATSEKLQLPELKAGGIVSRTRQSPDPPPRTEEKLHIASCESGGLKTTEILRGKISRLPDFVGTPDEYNDMSLLKTAPAEYCTPREIVEEIEEVTKDSESRLEIIFMKCMGPCVPVIKSLRKASTNWTDFKTKFLAFYEEQMLDIVESQLISFRTSGRRKGETTMSWFLRKRNEAAKLAKEMPGTFVVDNELRVLLTGFAPGPIKRAVKEAPSLEKALSIITDHLRWQPTAIPEVAISQESINHMGASLIATNAATETGRTENNMQEMIEKAVQKALATSVNIIEKKEPANPFTSTRPHPHQTTNPFSATRPHHPTNFQPRKNRFNQPPQARREYEPLCFYCTQPGHFIRECPLKNRADAMRRQNFQGRGRRSFRR